MKRQITLLVEFVLKNNDVVVHNAFFDQISSLNYNMYLENSNEDFMSYYQVGLI